VKVFISVDMEGISGLVRWADVVADGQDYALNRMILTSDANAAIEGAFAGGAEEVVVEENHGVADLTNIRMDAIDPRARVIRGAGRPTATTMAGLDGETGVVLLVGHHARAGSFPGIMAHTVSYQKFGAVRVGGADCGESEIFAIRAGELGVPVGMVSGDQVVCDQLRKRVPQVEAVEVKRALSVQSGDVIPPERAQTLIRAGAERAVRRARAGELSPYVEERAPWEIEVVLRDTPSPGLASNLAALPEFEIDADGVTIRTEAPDMDLGFRRIAYLSYGDREGLLRY
jgi:D-amino peptidase